MKSYSITRRLIATALLVEMLAALSISTAAMLYERHQRFRAFDIMLRGRADSLLGAVQDAEDSQDNVMLDGTEVNFPAEDIYEVQDAGGRVHDRALYPPPRPSPRSTAPTHPLRTRRRGPIGRASARSSK